MMPPTSGMQAIAAATFEGKPVDVGFGPVSDPALGEGGGGIGSWSGMSYIHKTANLLSSNLAFAALFRFRFRPNLIWCRFQRIPQMKNKYSHAFTLIELLVVIATVVILAALAIPVFNGVLDRAKATKDMSNLRQIGVLMQTYLNDKDGILPVINAAPGIGTTPSPVIYPKYIGSRRVFQSPFDKRAAAETDSAPVSYGINQNMYTASPGIAGNMTKVVSPSATILMAPNYNGNPRLSTSWTGLAAAAPFVPNLTQGGGGGMTVGPQQNGRKINALFCDLHVETMTFGPSSVLGSFQDYQSDPVGQKHWDPTK
jgi:prepilin-type N-terminal cleavage/methylation domain-containing protein/prepilin-type processing-associated H-X9-DG protein